MNTENIKPTLRYLYIVQQKFHYKITNIILASPINLDYTVQLSFYGPFAL